MTRYHLGGIGIVIALFIFLLLPLMTRNANHPLSGETKLDLCQVLGDDVFARMPETPVRVEGRLPNEKDEGKPVCTAYFPVERRGDPSRFVWVWVQTQRMMVFEGRAPPTDRVVETWITESKVSGSDIARVKGPWRSAAFITEPLRPGQIGLLVDDAGVMLNIHAQGLERDAVMTFGDAVARKLRARK